MRGRNRRLENVGWMPPILVFGAAMGVHAGLIACFPLFFSYDGLSAMLVGVQGIMVLLMTLATGITLWLTGGSAPVGWRDAERRRAGRGGAGAVPAGPLRRG